MKYINIGNTYSKSMFNGLGCFIPNVEKIDILGLPLEILEKVKGDIKACQEDDEVVYIVTFQWKGKQYFEVDTVPNLTIWKEG